MKFSACCTTRSSHYRFFVSATLVGLLSTLPRVAMAQQLRSRSPNPETVATKEQLRKTNDLQMEGKAPFHLKVKVQLYTLQGTPGDQASVEYWWAGDQGFHLDMSLPSIGTVHDTQLGKIVNPNDRRSVYLMTMLLDSIRFAGTAAWPDFEALSTEQQSFGQTPLKCIFPSSQKGRSDPDAVCVDPTTDVVRLQRKFAVSVVKNRTATFAGTRVSVATEIEGDGRKLIEGTIDTLESFSPSGSEVVLSGAKSEGAEAEAGGGEMNRTPRLPGGVVAGFRTGGSLPRRPPMTENIHMTGHVIVFARVTKEGRLTDLTPVMSSNQIFTGAVLEAVKDWTYRPYLLNGVPTDVDTTITVNFN